MSGKLCSFDLLYPQAFAVDNIALVWTGPLSITRGTLIDAILDLGKHLADLPMPLSPVQTRAWAIVRPTCIFRYTWWQVEWARDEEDHLFLVEPLYSSPSEWVADILSPQEASFVEDFAAEARREVVEEMRAHDRWDSTADNDDSDNSNGSNSYNQCAIAGAGTYDDPIVVDSDNNQYFVAGTGTYDDPIVVDSD